MARRRRRPNPAIRAREALGEAISGLIAHPIQTTVLSLASVLLLYFIATQSLPFAIASRNPDLAIFLNSQHPAGLMAKAQQLRQRLLELTVLSDGPSEEAAQRPATGNSLEALPVTGLSPEQKAQVDAERKELREQIRELAIRAIASDPLNARAFTLLAEVSEGREVTKAFAEAAVRRSRRETSSLFWLLNDSLYDKNYAKVVEQGDILLRTSPQLAPYVVGYLGAVADDPEARPLLVAKLKETPAPKWRERFFTLLPGKTDSPETPLALMLELKEAEEPLTNDEMKPYLAWLVREGLAEYAYNAWLRLLPEAELASVGSLYNASFDNEPAGHPFDWQLARGINATAELVPDQTVPTLRVLHLAFADGRVRFPTVAQVVVLAPGRYRIEGKLRGTIRARRGLKWQLRCLYGERALAGETEMLMGQSDRWRLFSFEATIPDGDDCRGQALRLIHDARMASEEFLAGEVWFDDMKITRLQDEPKAP
jgi:hypothetical protein